MHPGYGFLSENAEFAAVCRQCGLSFIGPTPEDMKQWGDKVTARAAAAKWGLPLLPGTDVLRDIEHAESEATRVGFPVMLKASGGGGGNCRAARAEPGDPGRAGAASAAANGPDPAAPWPRRTATSPLICSTRWRTCEI